MSGKQRASLEQRRAERELFFWTAEQWTKLVRKWAWLAVTVAFAVYMIVSLATGHDPAPEWLTRILK